MTSDASKKRSNAKLPSTKNHQKIRPKLNLFGGDEARQAPQRARVRIEVDGQIIGVRQLDKPIMTIGRLSGNDVQVPSQRVSRLHARVRWENGAWLIEDADSLNGISYKGQRVDKHTLSHGDRVYLAPNAVLQYEVVP